ncbi:MAG: PQQ-binding-like beta-propeller repeat protein [Dehalococcoidia bacterium]|nr:PQQ-binding-like beta-propeller repeat protein [Dehalococcoidia bacterium]
MQESTLRLGTRIITLLALLVLAALGGCSSAAPASSPTSSPDAPVPTPAAGIPPEVAGSPANWPLANKDYANTRAVIDSTIDSHNIRYMGAAWAFPLPQGQDTSPGALTGSPLIVGNVVVFQDTLRNVFALDLDTGKRKWEVINNNLSSGPNGVAVGWGKVFAAADSGSLSAYSLETGQELWTTALPGAETGPVEIRTQPVAYGDLVLVSTVPETASAGGRAAGAMGLNYALAQDTGQIVWSFNTVDSADLWGNKDLNSGGGSLYPPAVDVETGNTYWGVAGPGPYPGISRQMGSPANYPSGGSRPGPNLYTNSMIQLNAQTGSLDWYNQVWPHDIAGYDLHVSPVLASRTVGADTRSIVIGAGKMGHVYAFDRSSGALLWDCPVGIHNANTHLMTYPTAGNTVLVYPGPLGGVSSPMAYADGTVYVPVTNLGVNSTGYTQNLLPADKGTGELVAVDVKMGQVKWTGYLPSPSTGGATVVNDLVFTATAEGMIYGYMAATGELVWAHKAPAGVSGAPAVSDTYMIWNCAGPGGSPALLAFKFGAYQPIVQFASPADNATVPAGNLQLSLHVLNFNLADKIGQRNVPGEGHIIYYLNVEPPTLLGEPAIPEQGTWFATHQNSYTLRNLPPGTHTIHAQLVNNNHTPLASPVVSTITITVGGS